jgi:dipeptidyl aminopeptidase/acylaminoacyl peptidase
MVAARALLVAFALFVSRASCAESQISSSMMVEMREITSVSLAPDGARIVVGVCHPNPRTNKMELSWVIIPLRGAGKPITLPAGEDISDPVGPGALLNQQAQWSRDGNWFFYIRRDGAEVQLWETSSNGETTRQVTHSKSDLIGLAASADPDELIVTLAPDRDRLNKAEEEEDRNGILYDDRIVAGMSLSENLPVIDRWRNVRITDTAISGGWAPPGWNATTAAVFDIKRHKLVTRPGSAANASKSSALENANYRVTAVPTGQAAVVDPMYYPGQYTLQLESKAKTAPTVKCILVECVAHRITILGWSPNASEIYYVADFHGGGIGDRLPGQAAIYAWNPEGNSVRLIHDAGGRLYNLIGTFGKTVVPASIIDQEIVVASSGVDQPPLVETISLVDGAAHVIFDPNAELRALTKGRAAWRTWPTASAYPGRGVFVLPDDYQPGRRYPAVITSYSCGNGFLRGGGGDNAPEFVAAHLGFVAICVHMPVREIIADGSDMNRIYSTMCDIVSALIADQTKAGLLDSQRIGLSGQSLGANFGTYCIARSSQFAAAAFRHGSAFERIRWDLFDTQASRRDPVNSIYAKFGMPNPRNDPTGKWDAISVVRRARDINTPTLFEANDTEYLTTLPLWSAMHEESKAVEMRVFPKETHQLRQPVHQLMNFEQQLDWFRFWLKHEEDPDPSKRDQYIRWNKLRELSESPSPPR